MNKNYSQSCFFSISPRLSVSVCEKAHASNPGSATCPTVSLALEIVHAGAKASLQTLPR